MLWLCMAFISVITLQVFAQSDNEILPKKIILSVKEKTIAVRETLQLTYDVEPKSAMNKTVTWSSSNEAVAEVSNGLVTGKSPGSATITARSNKNNAVIGECKIKVKNVAIKTLSIKASKPICMLVIHCS